MIAAGERLVAKNGLDNVTLAHITKAAQQRNAAAIHYHFGGREGLLDAILERHHREIDSYRFAVLDDVDQSLLTVDTLVAMIVDPLIERLHSPSGRAFLIIQAERFASTGAAKPRATSLTKIGSLLAASTPATSAAASAERGRLAALLINLRLGHQAVAPDPLDQLDTLRVTLIAAVAAILGSSPANDH